MVTQMVPGRRLQEELSRLSWRSKPIEIGSVRNVVLLNQKCKSNLHPKCCTECLLHRVVPISAHAAFDKAGAYMGVKVHKIPVNPETRKADMKRMKRAMYVPCSFNYRYVLTFMTVIQTQSWCE